MSYGQAHRELVKDTNAGIIEPTSSEKSTSKAKVSGQQTTNLGGEHDALRALVTTADTVSKPIIAKINIEKEQQGYEDAGQEDGRQIAATAAEVWHNKLFGPSAGLRGANERIAEDNARKTYLAGQYELEYGNAATWNDEKWKNWKDKKIKTEIDKYKDHPEMQKFISTTMGRDMQKLERDRTWKHMEYLQAENRKSTQEQASTIAATFLSDLGSPNIQRSEEDTTARVLELHQLRIKSGISDKNFASVMHQTATDELAKGEKEFAAFIEEEGFLEDLTFEEQKGLENAVQVFDIKNGEEFGRRSNELYGSLGLIKQGDMHGAVAAYDALIRDFPQSVPEGGKNELRKAVRQAAWGHAETKRKRQARARHATDDAANDTITPFPERNEWGQITGWSMQPEHERLMGVQTHLAETFEAKFHEQQKLLDPTYEKRPITPDERQELYMENSAYTAKIMEQTNLLVPEVNNAAKDVINTINHDLDTLDDAGVKKLKTDLHRLNTMMHQNPAVKKMMKDALGDSFGKLVYANTELQKKGTTAEMLGNRLAIQSARQKANSPLSKSGTANESNKEAKHELDDSQRRQALKGIKHGADEDGFGPFFGAKRKTNLAIVDRVETVYSRMKENSENPHSDSEDAILLENAIAEVAGEGAYLDTTNGKEFFFDVGAVDDRLRAAGYTDGGLNQYVKEMGELEWIIEDIKVKSGGIELNSMFGNPLTSNGAVPVDLGGGELGLIIPRDDETDPRPAFVYRFDTPHVDDPKRGLPRDVQRDIARTKYADEIVVNSELWKEKTDDKRSPKEQLDYDLAYQIITEDPEAFLKKHNIPTKPGGTQKIEDLAKFVTQEDIEQHIDAHEYNKSLMDRRDAAVTRVVSRQRLRDNFVNDPLDAARGWNVRRKLRRDTQKSKDGVTEYENDLEVPYIQEGDTTTESRAKQNVSDLAHAERMVARRQAQSDAIQLPEQGNFNQRLKGFGVLHAPSSTDPTEDIVEDPIRGNDGISSILQFREGLVLKSYQDGDGVAGGVGHTLTPEELKKYPLGTAIPRDVVLAWYKADSAKAQKAAASQMKEAKIDPKTEVLIKHVGIVLASEIMESVNFQLGTAWNKEFNNTWPLIKQGEYKEAIKNLKASKWNKQTPKRVQDLIALLTTLDEAKEV